MLANFPQNISAQGGETRRPGGRPGRRVGALLARDRMNLRNASLGSEWVELGSVAVVAVFRWSFAFRP